MNKLHRIIILLLLMAVTAFSQEFHGVFVGISAYPYPNTLPNDCVWDAQDMRNILRDSYHWNSNNLSLLTDVSAKKTNILTAIENMPRTSAQNDIFFFSGHGVYGNGILTVDYEYIKPLELQSTFGTSYYSYGVFLDACYSGRFTIYMTHGVVSASSAYNEVSYCGGIGGHSVYTGYICQGLDNGYDVVEELHNYAAPLITSYEPDMTPQLNDNYSGNLILGYTLGGNIINDQNWYGSIDMKTISPYQVDIPSPSNPVQVLI
jgi:hypothetical protein